MTSIDIRRVLVVSFFAAFASAASPTYSQPTPTKPLRIIIPFGPGSAADSQGRHFAEQLGKVLEVGVYVENKPGANGALGMRALKAAPADGGTLAMVSPSLVVTPILSRNAGYAVEDFRAVAGMSKGPIGFFARADSPFRTLADALDTARRENRPLAMGTYAGSYQIGAAWLSTLAGVPITNVSYRGGSQAVTDLVGGSLETMSADYLSMLPLVRDGKLRALAIASEKRQPDMPEVPTVNELYPGYVNFVWTGLVVRGDTPEPLVERLSRAMAAVMARPDTHDHLTRLGWQPLGLDGPAMARFIEAEDRRFKEVAKRAGLEAQ